MTTELFAITSGLGVEEVARVVPPACRGPIDRASITTENGDVVIASPTWRPRMRARYFVPAFAMLSECACSFRLELAIETAGAWSAWVAASPIGRGAFPPMLGTDVLGCDIDVFTARDPVDAVRFRARIRDGADVIDRGVSWLATLSVSDIDAPRPSSPPIATRGRASIHVPARSQMDEAAAIRHRICSPTSVAMVLGRWGRSVAPTVLASEMLHETLDLYGVWPAAIAAGARRGVAGYLLRFPDWESAAWCLRSGLPVVASVRYARGELRNAAIAETSGHLLVLTGYDGDDVLVNDPAAPSRDDVPRRYRREDVIRVWLDRVGVGYVFFDPQTTNQTGPGG